MPKSRNKTDDTKTESSRRRAERVLRREFAGPDPMVRIGLMEEYDRIDLKVHGRYSLTDLAGDLVVKNFADEVVWHVTPDRTTEARAIFSILTTASAKRDSADRLRKTLTQKNQPARVVDVGDQIVIDGRLVADNVKYRVLVGRWSTEREARKHIDQFRDEFAPRVVRQIVRPATGTLELSNEGFTKSRIINDGFRLVPAGEDGSVTLMAVREGTGFHWEREVDRSYPAVIEVRIDHRGLLMSLVELPIELYLKGVVPAEMPASYPMEALKAQAVAARSEVLAKLGIKHPNDPFDLCAHVHCQAYAGCTHHDKRTSQAVETTRGQVLMLEGQVAEAVYSACCGGHTEDKLNVWNPPEAAHLKGGWDATSGSDMPGELDLSRESDVEKWVTMSPPVWCNTDAQQGLPDILARASKYFRWEVTYSRRELEEIIRRKSGEDIGTLINVVPIHRGNSGRLMEMEIQGSRRNLKVQRELNIRNILSPQYLFSACFTVEVDTGEDGGPINFRLKGAGWGHGVGMCQVGAGVMAAKGKKCREILAHYYPGTKVEKVYGD